MLENIFQKTLRTERHFEHKSVLLTTRPPYPTPMVTLLEGLEKLGFELYRGAGLTADFTLQPMDDDRVLVKPGPLLFSAKKQSDDVAYYLPYGIPSEYMQHTEDKVWDDRQWDFAAINQGYPKQEQLYEWLRLNDLPGKVYNGRPDDVWEVLNDTRFLIYPGRRSSGAWDSELPWMGLAAGCLLLVDDPSIDVRAYPITDVAFTYQGLPLELNYDQGDYEEVRSAYTKMAQRYFSPVAIARYVLHTIHNHRRW